MNPDEISPLHAQARALNSAAADVIPAPLGGSAEPAVAVPIEAVPLVDEQPYALTIGGAP